MKRPVSHKALVDRLRRALKKEGISLHRARPDSPFKDDLGEWSTADANGVKDKHVKLEQLAIEIGCLKENEEYIAE